MREGILSILQTHSEVFRVFGVFRDVPGSSGVPVFRVPAFLEILHALSSHDSPEAQW